MSLISKVNLFNSNLSLCLKKKGNNIFLYKFYFIFFKDFIYLFLERGKGREKEKERNINAWLPLVSWPRPPHPHAGHLACKPGMCPDWELNR